jgi:hypothetical protein
VHEADSTAIYQFHLIELDVPVQKNEAKNRILLFQSPCILIQNWSAVVTMNNQGKTYHNRHHKIRLCFLPCLPYVSGLCGEACVGRNESLRRLYSDGGSSDGSSSDGSSSDGASGDALRQYRSEPQYGRLQEPNHKQWRGAMFSSLAQFREKVD